MPSSSKIIKESSTDQKNVYSGISLPVFHKPVTASDSTNFPPSTLPDFSPKGSPSLNEMPSSISNVKAEPMARPIAHSAVLRGGNGQSLVNCWFAPVLQGNNSHHIKTVKSSKTEDMTKIVADANEQAAEILAEARNKAAEIIADAKKETENLRRQAFMEGMNAAKSEASKSMHQVERVLQETQLWQEQVMHQSQGRIMEMIVEIGRKLFGDGFDLPAEQLDHVVSRAINEGSRLGNLRIYLHPEDSKILVNLWQESEITVNGQRIQIVSSQNISRGGCFVDGQYGIVDGRVEEQMDQIAESLKPVVTNPGSEEA